MDFRDGGEHPVNTNLWFLKGLKHRTATERFPYASPEKPPIRPSRMEGTDFVQCPVKAIGEDGKWDMGKCIFCRKCEPDFKPTGDQGIYRVRKTSPKELRRSFYIYPLDSGSCGSCNIEFLSIFNPQYDASRLKIFMTNTPRHADALIVMGIRTEGMEAVLREALEAMPGPKVVISMGSCSISGGILGSSPLPEGIADLEISGCPPSPYTIIEAIMKLRGD